jgi:hypothetical protein
MLSLSESPFSLPLATGAGLDLSLGVILALAAAVRAAPRLVEPPSPRQVAKWGAYRFEAIYHHQPLITDQGKGRRPTPR